MKINFRHFDRLNQPDLPQAPAVALKHVIIQNVNCQTLVELCSSEHFSAKAIF